MGSDPKTASDNYHEQFTESSFTARYSQWDDNQAWSFQEWNADRLVDDRTGQPVVTSWGKHASPNQVSFMRRPSTMENNCQSIANFTYLTLKQMFDKSTRLASEQDEIFGLETIISVQRTKVYVFSDSVLCLGKMFENPDRTMHGKTDWDGSKVHRNAETWTESTVS